MPWEPGFTNDVRHAMHSILIEPALGIAAWLVAEPVVFRVFHIHQQCVEQKWSGQRRTWIAFSNLP